LCIVHGATSYEDLKTIDCILYLNFKVACIAYGTRG